MGTISCPGYSTPIQLPVKSLEKTAQDGTSVWSLGLTWETWLKLLCLALTIAGIWTLNQQEDLSRYVFPSLKLTLTFKIKNVSFKK